MQQQEIDDDRNGDHDLMITEPDKGSQANDQ